MACANEAKNSKLLRAREAWREGASLTHPSPAGHAPTACTSCSCASEVLKAKSVASPSKALCPYAEGVCPKLRLQLKWPSAQPPTDSHDS
eukprot:1145512-Alexandrium_andersonii.AAC.1